MHKFTLISATLLAGALTILGTGCDKLKSRDDLNKGVNAYKNAKYADAVNFFKDAIALDESNPNARTYLATAYMMQWIPGADSVENKQFASQARDEFNKVLSKNPNETVALASMASLAYNEADALPNDQKMAKLDEAADWYKKLITADPKNEDGYYSLGAIAQKKFYPALMGARLDGNMKPDEPGPLKDKKVKAQLTEKYGPILDDGIANLKKSLEIDPEKDDAMAYMNLLIREKADLAEDKDAYKAQVADADMWLQKALDTKKAKQDKAEKKTQGGIVQE